VLPPGAIVGASVGSADEVLTGGDADYWGVGPWRATATKPDAGAALDAGGFSELVRAAGGRPCIAIGGVRAEDVPAVLGAGGVGVAVVMGILGASDTEAAARRYAAAFGSPAR
jgi:thiamine-phosphate diphosphorylase